MRNLYRILFAVCLSCILKVSAATVETPMTQDLDANGYVISNIADLITAGPWADVRAYGADPTGVNDSSTAFNNAGTSGVGTVFVPKGTYRLNSGVSFSGVNVIMEGPGIVTLNYYGTGPAITFNSGHGTKLQGFKLVSQDSDQDGVLFSSGSFGYVSNIIINDFDGVGFQVGVAGTSGVYYAKIDNIMCRNPNVQGTIGILVDGGATPNSNANTFRNVTADSKWTTLYHIKGSQNKFIGGDCVIDTTGNGVTNAWLIEGIGNEFDGSYFELCAGSSLPDNVFKFTSDAFSNTIKNIYTSAVLPNVYSCIDDAGWANEVIMKPIGWNFSFPVEERGVENLIPNSHFKYWNGATPVGWSTWNSNVAQESSIVRGAKYSLKLSGTNNNLSCYVAGHSSSITGLPIERFQGKTVVAGVWVKADAEVNPLKVGGYGNNKHTGDGTWQFITAIAKVPIDATSLSMQLRNGAGDVYFSEPVLVEGVHLPHPNPRPINDSYARMTGPFIGSPFIIFADGDTSPDISDGNHFKTASSLATTITNFDGGAPGQEITIVFGDANTTVSDSGNIKLSGAFTSTADDTLKLLYDGTYWYEISRSVN